MSGEKTSSQDGNETPKVRKSKIVYIDLDDTLFDFSGPTYDSETGKIREHMMWDKDFFFNLKPLPGARKAVFQLIKMGFDVWILSQPLVDCPESYTDKAKSVQIHFPQLYKKIILTQDKGLHLGDFLIDDNLNKWEQPFHKNGGQFVHFPYGGYNGLKENWVDPEERWERIIYFMSKQNPYQD